MIADPIISAGVDGVVIGLAIAAPVGAIGTLVIRRSLTGGFPLGFATGMGAAVADGLYGALAALGFAALAPLLASMDVPLRLVGSAVLLWLAYGIARAPVAMVEQQGTAPAALSRAFASTFVLTLINPTTILMFAALFAARAVADTPVLAAVMAAGVFLGSTLWWLTLAGLVGSVRRWLRPGWLVWINRTSAAILTLFAVSALVGLL
ncbi:MAG: LysE family transporter [Alphaproteobacteria bacterium]|nr:LysE family transporter [Alphaproteobacteria bacterium]